MNRTSIINALIAKVNAKSYLEIGLNDGENFAQIVCPVKVAVDPEPKVENREWEVHRTTSDDFFVSNTREFDVVFVDGLHHADQVEKDIGNAFECLTENGVIICHDMNPQTEEEQRVPYAGGRWNGDCWKAFVALRGRAYNLFTCTVDVDEGVSIISRKKGNQPISITEPLTYENLVRNRSYWLNLITLQEFYQAVLGLDLKPTLAAFVTNPSDEEANFALAQYYESIGQTASALSFYLRTAERTKSNVLAYESLIRGAGCFEKQGTRGLSVRGMLQRAIALIPERPEAYYLLSRFFERAATVEGWMNCYTYACMAEKFCNFGSEPLRTHVEYPGSYGILFEKAVSGWWMGQCVEARDNFIRLMGNEFELDQPHRASVINNLKFLKQMQTDKIRQYDKSKLKKLKMPFKGVENIEQNYSESYQDMFVLAMLNGKRNGTYLEIGAGKPFRGNNTALLEKDFGWKGVSFDIDPQLVSDFNRERKNPCLGVDATSMDVTQYTDLLTKHGLPRDVDYLQLDLEPLEVTFQALTKVPFDNFRFAVITFEHDAYSDVSQQSKHESRRILKALGYELVVQNVAPDNWRYYEDWWVHPELVGIDRILEMKALGEKAKCAEEYMLSMSEGFDWGQLESNRWFKSVVNDEIFNQSVYEKFHQVERGDIVLDVGASVGPFAYSIVNKNPKAIFCLEPHPDLFPTLVQNARRMSLGKYTSISCINQGIASFDGEGKFTGLYNKDSIQLHSISAYAQGITFANLVSRHGIPRIDFLKTDCEGGEYDIFTIENYDWITKNVGHVAGEWHVNTPELKEKFKVFREVYLKNFPHKVLSMDYVDITHDVFNEHFLSYYATVNLYITFNEK